MSKNNTQDTLKDLIGDIADSVKKAFDEILDRDDEDDNCTDRSGFGAPLQALTGLPADVLRTAGALSVLGVPNPLAALAGGGANPLAALTGAPADPLAAATGVTNPLAALTGAAGAGANPLAGVAQLAGGAAGAVQGAAGTVEGLAQLPGQLRQLTEMVSALTRVLENVQKATGTSSTKSA
ncbi:hypothetical protein MTQ10_19570 [Streptomyces sp. XM83C]|uniref:hypothetical protein n=1 Tax=Streptomyces sp. XM83C TaxID=2929781 RepID=UPI001FFB5A78|nr:hypothetical protein [Streptomyces sp. XM83C]MCK1821753.1 hypothetical protein [Streptomyces sp. XM83C]